MKTETKGLHKCLTTPDLVLIGVGNTVGGGIFILVGNAVHIAGPAVILCFLLAGVATLCSALCYAEFASRFPMVGSSYVFTRQELGLWPAWNVGCAMVFEYVVAFAAFCRGWSGYVKAAIESLGFEEPRLLAEWHVAGISLDPKCLGLMLFLVLVMGRPMSSSKWVSHLTTSCKVLALVVVVGLGFSHGTTANWAPFVPNGGFSVVAGAGSVMLAFLGFDVMANAAEEATEPTRQVPQGIVLTVVISGLLYVTTGAALTFMQPWEKVDLHAPLSSAFASWLPGMASFISVVAVVGLVAITFGQLFAATRVILALARDKHTLLPPWLGQVSASGEPSGAIYAAAAAGATLSCLYGFEELIRMICLGTLCALSSVCVSLVLMRKRGSGQSGDGRLHELLCAFGAATFLSAQLWRHRAPTPLCLALAAVVLGSAAALLKRDEVPGPEGVFRAPAGVLVALVGFAINICLLVDMEVDWQYLTVWLALANVFYAACIGFQQPSDTTVLSEKVPTMNYAAA